MAKYTKKRMTTNNEIVEDVEDLQEDIDSVDKKLLLLIALWIIDKLVMAGLIVFLK